MSVYRTLVVLQATPFCNIDCRYCYLPDRTNPARMRVEVLERIAEQILSSPLVEAPIVFLWHLGEPLAASKDFYEEAFRVIDAANERHKREYLHSFQTNGTLLDPSWVELILRYRIRVGVSIDGPEFLHDRQRVTRNGKGTHSAVLRGIRLLQSAGAPFSVISVVTDYSLDYADEFFHFFLENAIYDVGFNIDEVEGIHATSSFGHNRSINRYRQFLLRLIDLTEQNEGKVKFREIWTNLRTLALNTPSAPFNTTNQPFRILNFDSTGQFSTFCPELVAAKSLKYGDFVMGNIMQDNLADIYENPVFQTVHRDIEAGIAACKQGCPYWNFCGGGSPSNKFFEHGRLDVTETTTCRIHKKATIDVLVEYLENKLQSESASPSLSSV
jgi:uncharacterized protein